MSRLDLGSAELTIVHDLLAAHLPSAHVWAFGSRTSGTARPLSDLDLAVVSYDQPLSPESLATLREALSLSDLPISVDVVDLARADDRFREAVMRTAVRIR